MIGFAQAEYTADESNGTVTVCIEMRNTTELECFFNFTFEISLTTIGDSASNNFIS